jgi:hypothetical protein
MESGQDRGVFPWIITTIVIPILNGLGLIIAAAVVVKLWDWFAVPSLGLHPLQLYPTAGLLVLIELIKGYSIFPKLSATEQKDADAMDQLIATCRIQLARPFFFLFFGWIVHCACY